MSVLYKIKQREEVESVQREAMGGMGKVLLEKVVIFEQRI